MRFSTLLSFLLALPPRKKKKKKKKTPKKKESYSTYWERKRAGRRREEDASRPMVAHTFVCERARREELTIAIGGGSVASAGRDTRRSFEREEKRRTTTRNLRASPKLAITREEVYLRAENGAFLRKKDKGLTAGSWAGNSCPRTCGAAPFQKKKETWAPSEKAVLTRRPGTAGARGEVRRLTLSLTSGDRPSQRVITGEETFMPEEKREFIEDGWAFSVRLTTVGKNTPRAKKKKREGHSRGQDLKAICY